MRKLARQYGYDIPSSGCFEYTSRADRDLGAQRQAEWYACDMLTGLAYGFPRPPGTNAGHPWFLPQCGVGGIFGKPRLSSQ